MKKLLPFVAGLLLAGTAQAAGNKTIYNPQPASASAAYWTADRMEAAIPRAAPRSGTAAVPATVPVIEGVPKFAGSTQVFSVELQNQLTGVIPDSVTGSYPGPSSTWQIRNLTQPYTDAPFSFVGTLFFTEPAGDFRCSASVTYGDAGLDTIWTAGHCVADGGRSKFFTNWRFCPAWNNNAPSALGCWDWAAVSVPNEWFVNGAFTRDFAAIQLRPTGTVVAAHVVNAVGGGFGFAWNLGRAQNWVHLGYPAVAPFNGNKLIATATEHRFDDIPDQLGPPTNSWGSPQTPGSSGSPVIVGWGYGDGATGPGFLNSNVSYFYQIQAFYELYGPYFDTAACVFWKSATGWPGTC
jgi:hypothetical protein